MLTRGFLGSVLVLLGGLVVSTLPPSAALMQHDLFVDLRASEIGRMLGLGVAVAGLAILATEWLTLCRHVAPTEGEDRDDAVQLVRHAAVVWSAPLVLAPPLFSRDGWSYAAQGMLAHLHLSPYDVGPAVLHGPVVEAVDPRWMETPAPYGPLPLVLGDLAAGFTGNPWVLVVGHRVVALVGLVLLAWAVPRLASWTGVNPALASAVVLVSPLMLAHGVGGLHNDLLMVGLMATALVVGVERGWMAGALIGGLAAAVKVPGGLVCIAIALASLPVAATLGQRLRRLTAAAGLSVGLLLGLGLVTGLGAGWVHGLGAPVSVRTPLSVTCLVDGVLGGTGAVRTVGTVVSLGAVVAIAFRWPTGARVRALQAAAALTGVVVLLGPVVHPWYLLWVVPFVAVLRLAPIGLVALLAGSTILGLVAPFSSATGQADHAIVLGKVLVALLVALLLLTPRARRRLQRIASAGWVAQPALGATTPATSPSVIRPPEVPGAL